MVAVVNEPNRISKSASNTLTPLDGGETLSSPRCKTTKSIVRLFVEEGLVPCGNRTSKLTKSKPPRLAMLVRNKNLRLVVTVRQSSRSRRLLKQSYLCAKQGRA